MQVSDPTTPGAPSVRADQPDAAGGARIEPPARRRARFRESLDLSRENATAAEGAVALAQAPAGQARAPSVVAGARPAVAVGLAPAESILRPPRVLVGTSGDSPEARIQISSGALAGAEIRLTAAGGAPAVTAQLLTADAGSRETLSRAMDEIRARLRARGIAFGIRRPDGPRPGDRERQER